MLMASVMQCASILSASSGKPIIGMNVEFADRD